MHGTSQRHVQNNRATRIRGRRRWRTAERMSSSITLMPWTAPFTVLHHSLTGDISCDPANHKHHSKVKEKKRKNLERHSQVRLSAAFHATAWPGKPLEANLLQVTKRIHVTHEICDVKWKSSRWMCTLMSGRKGKVAISSLLSSYLSARLWRQTLRHVKVKDWHQIKDCLKSELSKLYAHHLSCYQ